MFPSLVYKIYHCKIHQKHIHYFVANEFGKETQCWDCRRDAANKKPKEEISNELDASTV